MTDEELVKLLSEATDEQLGEIVTGMLYAGVKVATDRGVPPLKAVRGVVALYFQDFLGRGVWKELHVHTRTAERWRKELREMLAEAPEIEDAPSQEILDGYARLRAEKIAQDQEAGK